MDFRQKQAWTTERRQSLVTGSAPTLECINFRHRNRRRAFASDKFLFPQSVTQRQGICGPCRSVAEDLKMGGLPRPERQSIVCDWPTFGVWGRAPAPNHLHVLHFYTAHPLHGSSVYTAKALPHFAAPVPVTSFPSARLTSARWAGIMGENNLEEKR